MEGEKYYRVTMYLNWMSGGYNADAELVCKVFASSPGHAISRVKDHLEDIGMHTVEDAKAEVDDIEPAKEKA